MVPTQQFCFIKFCESSVASLLDFDVVLLKFITRHTAYFRHRIAIHFNILCPPSEAPVQIAPYDNELSCQNHKCTFTSCHLSLILSLILSFSFSHSHSPIFILSLSLSSVYGEEVKCRTPNVSLSLDL